MNFRRNYKKYSFHSGLIRKKFNHRPLVLVLVSSLVCILLASVLTYHLSDAVRTHQNKSGISKISSLRFPNLPFLARSGGSQPTPTTLSSVNFTHQNITSTYFWVGEPGDADNGYIANTQSAWDEQWSAHFGGLDDPAHRNGYYPAGFTPKENPFYFALPYNDVSSNGSRKNSASSCLAYAVQKQANYSWCKNLWIAIRHKDNVVYAQWEDVGPFGEDDASYVFGGSSPTNKTGSSAGIDVSPAVKDYLGLGDVDKVDWAFITPNAVPQGVWKQIVTSSFDDSIN